jgi:Phage integrase family
MRPIGLHVLRHSAAARMIRAGASPKTVLTVLGHASAAFTLTLYGHIFDADLDDLTDRLEILGRDGVEPIARVRQTVPADLGKRRWGGQDLNLRPTDYESGSPCSTAVDRRRPRATFLQVGGGIGGL